MRAWLVLCFSAGASGGLGLASGCPGRCPERPGPPAAGLYEVTASSDAEVVGAEVEVVVDPDDSRFRRLFIRYATDEGSFEIEYFWPG